MTVRHRAYQDVRRTARSRFSHQIVGGHDVARVEHADAVRAMTAMEYHWTDKWRPTSALLVNIRT